VVVEVVVGIVAASPTVTVAVRAAMPAVRAAVATTASVRPSSPGPTLTRAPAAQTGQRLRDGFGGIRCGVVRFGVVRFVGHRSILHAT
jgi:hypothetical protein